DLATLALALVAVSACGGTRSAHLYLPAVLLFILFALWVRRHDDGGRAPLGKLRPVALWAGALLFILAGGVATGTALGLPRLQGWVITQASRYMLPRTGFSDYLRLGTMRGMLQSDRKVLRVSGPSPDHLRGIVYSRYLGGRWSVAPDHETVPVQTPFELEPTADRVTLEVLDDHPRRYFLPLEATQVAVDSGVARLDPTTVLAPVPAEPAETIWYRTEGERSYALAAPGDGDVAMPEAVRAAVAPLARRWTAGAADRAAVLAALEQHLQTEFAYTLEVEMSGRRDPVVQFLLEQRRGHCEYFASAMALLSRSLGIPARVVAGYRVTERNELGDYYIVRERNAHAWVEAWVPGQGWRTFDPTPPTELLASSTTSTPLGAALVDLAGRGWRLFLDWLDRRTPQEMLAPPAVFGLLLLLVRWLRSRAERRRQLGGRTGSDPPLPCLADLSQALGLWGIVRGASETLEQLAHRLSETRLPEERAGDAATLLRRYAAHRYGNVGDEAALVQDIDRFCRQLSRQ
ncbi:MAG: DUF3488 domain-containing protein, partial [Deltaproteobacteria bacterium]|nr:DUF3488 domain-containing protein [Deltaproteobacteria bacterium]